MIPTIEDIVRDLAAGKITQVQALAWIDGHMNSADLRDCFMAAALQNSALCNGEAKEWELTAWFGNRNGITRQEIIAKQAGSYADAMLAARKK